MSNAESGSGSGKPAQGAGGAGPASKPDLEETLRRMQERFRKTQVRERTSGFALVVYMVALPVLVVLLPFLGAQAQQGWVLILVAAVSALAPALAIIVIVAMDKVGKQKSTDWIERLGDEKEHFAAAIAKRLSDEIVAKHSAGLFANNSATDYDEKFRERTFRAFARQLHHDTFGLSVFKFAALGLLLFTCFTGVVHIIASITLGDVQYVQSMLFVLDSMFRGLIVDLAEAFDFTLWGPDWRTEWLRPMDFLIRTSMSVLVVGGALSLYRSSDSHRRAKKLLRNSSREVFAAVDRDVRMRLRAEEAHSAEKLAIYDRLAPRVAGWLDVMSVR